MLIRVCLRILASSRIPRYDLGRQTPSFLRWFCHNQFNSNNERMRPPLHLIGHEVYEMVKDVHVVHGKQKGTRKNTEEDEMWKKQ
jgi:hypothetical protein